MIGKFPFGEEVQPVEQKDRTQKQAFILGVYASAIHARWLDVNQKTVIKALAVASEPYIFWRGDEANKIIQNINIPLELGKLIPADNQFNGPSGIALDELIIEPLGLLRNETWLCDLVPHSCMNPAQKRAIDKRYSPLIEKYNLPIPTVPKVPSKLADDNRRNEILVEIEESQANILILLGDQPIRWFLRYYLDEWTRLSDFSEYGRLHSVDIDGRKIDILPLAHPRQIARLGRSSKKWYETHQDWLQKASDII